MTPADKLLPIAYDTYVLWYLLALLGLVFLAAVWLVGGAVRRYRYRQRVSKALRQFRNARAKLQGQFVEIASESGKPRGLAWKQCDFHDEDIFARDRATGEFYALTGVTIGFEAIAGGGMEEVEAVGNLRCATAVFVHRTGRWTTDGRVVFNHEPLETLQRYRDSLEPLQAT